MSKETKKNYAKYPAEPRPVEERTPVGDIPDTYDKENVIIAPDGAGHGYANHPEREQPRV